MKRTFAMTMLCSATPRLCALLLLVSSVAQGADPLRWKWAEGDPARYLMTQTMDMSVSAGPAGTIKSKTRQKMIINWAPDSVAESGETTLRQGLERVFMATDGPMGQSFAFDTASDEPPAGMAALIAPVFHALVASPVIVKMLPTGKITDVQMSDELADAVGQLPGGGMTSETIAQMTKQAGVAFPEGELTVGQDWESVTEVEAPQIGKMIVTTTYTYNGPKDVDGRSLESITPRVEMAAPSTNGQPMQIDFNTRESSGEILFDREAGRIASSNIDMTIEIVILMQGRKITNEMIQSTTLTELAPGQTPEFGVPAAASMAE